MDGRSWQQGKTRLGLLHHDLGALETIRRAFALFSASWRLYLALGFLMVSVPMVLTILPFGGWTEARLLLKILAPIFQAPLLTLIIRDVLRAAYGHERPNMREMLRETVPFLLPMLMVTALQSLLTTIGLILFIIPGLMVMTIFVVAVPVVAAESLPSLAALRRSAALTKGYRWPIFRTLMLLGLIAIAAITGVVMVSGVPGQNWVTSLPFAGFVGGITAFAAVTVGVLYHDLCFLKGEVA